MIDVDGIMTKPQYLALHPKEVVYFLKPGDSSVDGTAGKAGDGLDDLMGNLGMLAVDIRLGEDGVENDAFRAGNLDTAEDSL
jgi:hypothetical protein